MIIEHALSNDKKQLVNLLLNAQQLHQHQSIVHIHHELPLINLINTFFLLKEKTNNSIFRKKRKFCFYQG